MPAEHVVEGAFVRGQEVAGGTAISYAYFFWRAVDVFEHADAGHVIRRRQNRAQRQPALRSNPLRIGKIAVCHVQLGQEVAGGTAISYAYFFWRAVDVFEHADA